MHPQLLWWHISRRIRYARAWEKQPLGPDQEMWGWARGLRSGKQDASEEEGWELSQDLQQAHRSEVAGRSWASCQLTITCSETTMESNFPPSDSVSLLFCPLILPPFILSKKWCPWTQLKWGSSLSNWLAGHFRDVWMMTAHQSLGM